MDESNQYLAPTATTHANLVEYFMIVVPELASLDTLARALSDLVDSAIVRILDVVCVTRSGRNGELTVHELDDVDSLRAMREIDGDAGGLLSERDIETASVALPSGSSAMMLLIEDRWAERLSAAAQRAGGLVVGGERIAGPRVEAALRAKSAKSTAKIPGPIPGA